MDPKCILADWSIELVPLSAAAHATTLLGPNLRYIAVADRLCAHNQRSTKGRAIALSASAFLGRQCFSFGAARSNDYQLPRTKGVAPHHFILFLNPHDRAVYLKNTCTDGVRILSDSGNVELAMSDLAFKVDHTVTIRLGDQSSIRFRIRVPALLAQEYEAFFPLYLASIQPTTVAKTPPTTSRKRQASMAGRDLAAKKRCCTAGPAKTISYNDHIKRKGDMKFGGSTQSLRFRWGWFGNVARAFGF